MKVPWLEAGDRQRQISHDTTYMWNLKKNGTNELIYKTELVSENRHREQS